MTPDWIFCMAEDSRLDPPSLTVAQERIGEIHAEIDELDCLKADLLDELVTLRETRQEVHI